MKQPLKFHGAFEEVLNVAMASAKVKPKAPKKAAKRPKKAKK